MSYRQAVGVLLLGAVGLVPAAAQAQTYTKAQLQETYTQYLSAEGYRPELTNAGNVRFRREGKNYVIYVDEKDPTFFRLVMALSFEDKSAEARAARLEGINAANMQTKVVKSFVDKENDVYFAAEMFFIVPGDFKAAMPRTLRAIDFAHDKFRAGAERK